MIRVYTASKLSRAGMWLGIHLAWPEIYCHARWLKHSQVRTADSPANARAFWAEDQADIAAADCLVVMAEGLEHLRGALVEVGMALALGKKVYVIGEHEDYSTWQYHSLVTRVRDLAEFRLRMQELDYPYDRQALTT